MVRRTQKDMVDSYNLGPTQQDTPRTVLATGSGSGLDADLLDGQDGTYYLDLANHTGRLSLGTGEQFNPNNGDVALGGPHVEGSVVNIERGTTAAPDTTLQSTLKVSRVLQVVDADLVALGAPATTVGDQYLAAIAGFCKGTTGNKVQPIGVFGSGINHGQADDATLANTRPDAVGVAGYGFTYGPGGGIGGYFEGSRAVATGYCDGIEVLVRNLVTGSPVAYDPLVHHSCGVWLTISGEADCGTGFLLGHHTVRQFDVGFGIQGTNVSGTVGSARVASFRDDGNATTVFDINGSHTNGLDTTGATFSGHAILLASGHTASWGDVGLKRSSAGMLTVTDGAAGTGSLTADDLVANDDLLVGGDAAITGSLNINNTNELTLASVNHALTIGSHLIANLALDQNEIQARSAGSAAQLNLNPHGGTVTVGGTALASIATSGSAADLSGGILPDARMPNLTGDVTTVEGAVATTLATVNSNVGTFGSTSAVPVITTNAKGLITAVTTAALGTAAVKSTGTSGDTVPLLNAGNTWNVQQTFAITASTPREVAWKATVTDAGNDALYLANATATASRFQPSFTGFTDSADNVASLAFSGFVMAPRDVGGDAGLGVINFRSAIISSDTDPVNGTLSALANRTLFSFSNASTRVVNILTTGYNALTGFAYHVNSIQVVGARRTGWAVDTGTAKRTANATYAGTAEATYTQATIQTLMDKVRDLSQTIKALKDDLHGTAGHGLIGT